jgi:creatinine amidohydrolase
MKNSRYSLNTLLRPLLVCAALAGANLVFAADDAPKHWRWETMKPADLAEALATRPLAWLVLSPLEWHGDAIAFGADPLVGTTVAEGAWKRAGGVLIPTLYIGSETQYKEWDKEKGLVTRWGMELISREHNPGSLYVRSITLELVLVDYLKALQREGFKYIVIVSGHGGTEHLQVIREVCARDWGDMKVMVGSSWGRNLPANLRLKPVGDPSHANIGEASRVGGIDPSLVDPRLFGVSERDRRTGLRHENADGIDFEKGHGMIEFAANALAERVNEFTAGR